MTPAQHRRAGELLEAAAAIPPQDREKFLDAECGPDVELRRHVAALLAAEEDAPESFLAKPALEVAANLLAEQHGVPGITAGMRLGVYRIGPLIGQGGMGAVYEGFDVRLQRKAAIKILPVQFAGDPDRVRRFQLEARAASQLNHPNIVSIYDADFDAGYSYIAAELVEGETLRQLMAHGPLDSKAILEIGVQLCSALAAAHDAKIVHRDIKPENVMRRPDGIVKVLDFGLAKLAEPASGQTDLRTRPGGILGTVHYLSPEQVLGKPAGPQSDVFSAGVVLYELAAGSRPFDGPTDGAIFTRIVSEAPARVSELSRRIDKDFEAVILRALEKDPELRFQTANDFRAALRLLLRGSQSPGLMEEARSQPRNSRNRWMLQAATVAMLVIAAIAGMVLASAVWLNLRPAPASLPDHFERLTFGEGEEIYPNFFPDGKQFVYASSARGHWDIYLQRTGGSAAINLTPASEEDNTEPALSRDGSKIAFRSERSGGGLFVMEATGENPRRISASGHLPSWSPDGKSIVYCDSTFVMPNDRGATVSRLHVLDLASSTDRTLETGDAVQPNWSPHGDRIAYWGISGGGKRRILTVGANGGLPEPVTDGPAIDVSPVWAPSGRELYFISDRGGTMNLWRIRVDEHSGKTGGSPQPVTTPASYVRFLSWSADGSKFLYSQSQNRISLSSIEFDPARLEAVGAPAAAGGNNNIGNFSISPDGSKIVHDTVGDPHEDLWIVNVDGSDRHKLTSDSYRNRLPSWSPKGEEILFISNRSGKYQEYLIRPDGSGLRALTASPNQVNAGVWIDGGRRVVASLFELGLAMLDANAAVPITEPAMLPGIEKSNGSYAFVSPAENGLLLGHINGTGENPLVLYSLPEGKLSRIGVKGTRPVWIPGSHNRYFLFLREDACFLYDREQRREKKLFSTAHNQLYFLQLAPGGRRIFFTQTIREAQIWMADLPR